MNQSALPTAPVFETIPGYENTHPGDYFCASPPNFHPETNISPPSNRPPIRSTHVFNEENVREALVHFASEKCCYRVKPAKQCQIKAIDPSSVYHYKLETYTEKRETSWITEPYNGQMLDTPMNGPAPGPWEMQVPNRFGPFQDGKTLVEVPHTASLRPCHSCVGLGRKPCPHCMSLGRVRCQFCGGHDHHHHHHHHHHECEHCCDGWRECHHCHGQGQVSCDVCAGRAQLKAFIRLCVTMKTHKGEYVSKDCCHTDLSDNLIKDSEGQILFTEEGPRVFPLQAFPDSGTLGASRDLVNQHSSIGNDSLVHCQRHSVRVVPIAAIHCDYRNKEKKFYVYGCDNKVYFPDYYGKCCSCCSIQ